MLCDQTRSWGGQQADSCHTMINSVAGADQAEPVVLEGWQSGLAEKKRVGSICKHLFRPSHVDIVSISCTCVSWAPESGLLEYFTSHLEYACPPHLVDLVGPFRQALV